jgi:phosphodiesterase/alkaline phosphatase D-like protein
VPVGPLADLLMLDTRLSGREEPAAGRRPVLGVLRRDRALLGPEQWEWLEAALGQPAAAPARPWALVASQVVTAPIHLLATGGVVSGAIGRRLGAVGGGLIVNSGQWDG